jgi:chaperonin GroES
MAFLDAAMTGTAGGPPANGQLFDEILALEGGDGVPAEQEERPFEQLVNWIKSKNIAEEFDDTELQKIGRQVIREFDIDDQSRSEWMEENREAFKLAMQVAEEKTHPWPRASNVIFPLMTVAAVQFAARAYPAIVAGRNVVKGVVIGSDEGTPQIGPDGTPVVQMPQGQPQGAMQGQMGQGQPPMPQGQPGEAEQPQQLPQPVWQTPPGAKRQRADKIASHMSHQLLDEMDDWEEDTDKLLHILPIAGCCFRKTYFDPGTGQNISDLAMAENVVINYWAKSMTRAARISERVWFYPHEIEENERSGIWLENEYRHAVESGDDEESRISSEDDDAPHEFIEQHRRLDLDDDGYAEPYIVTVHRATSKVVRIVARYDPDGVKIRGDKIARIEAVEYYTKYDFMPNPEGGIYGIGLGKLLSPLNHSVNTIINQLIDAGTLANTPSGFIGRGLSMHSGAVKFKMGQFTPVNSPGSRIREAIVPFEFKEPSQVLFMLLGLVIDAAKDVASIKDVLTGETVSANMSPTTLMGMIDQGLQVFVGIYKRVHRALKKELDKLYRLNRVYLEDNAGFENGGIWTQITREDYEHGSGVQPISDPSMVSNQQKLARAELLRSYTGDPDIDQIKIKRRTLEAADIEDIDDLFVKQKGPDPAMVAMQAQMELEQKKLQVAEAKEMREAQQFQVEERREAALSRAKEIETYARAVHYLAQADKASADQDIAWTHEQINYLKLRMEGLNGRTAQAKPSSGGNGKGKRLPPFPDAREASDGNFYIPDQSRPGKFLRVIEDMVA